MGAGGFASVSRCLLMQHVGLGLSGCSCSEWSDTWERGSSSLDDPATLMPLKRARVSVFSESGQGK